MLAWTLFSLEPGMGCLGGGGPIYTRNNAQVSPKSGPSTGICTPRSYTSKPPKCGAGFALQQVTTRSIHEAVHVYIYIYMCVFIYIT